MPVRFLCSGGSLTFIVMRITSNTTEIANHNALAAASGIRPERDCQHREGGKVLELVVPVLDAIQGFRHGGARRRFPVNLEVRHPGGGLEDEDPDCEGGDEARDEQLTASDHSALNLLQTVRWP